VVHGETGGLHPVDLVDRGKLRRIYGRAVAANLPAHIARRMSDRAHALLSDLDAPVEIVGEQVDAACPGAGIFLTTEYDNCCCGFAALGKRGKPSERVAEEAVEQLGAHHRSGGALDRHLADQILLPLAMASGVSRISTERVSEHLRTNAWVIERFRIARIHIDESGDGTGIITVEPQHVTGWQARPEERTFPATPAGGRQEPAAAGRAPRIAPLEGHGMSPHGDRPSPLDWNVVVTCQPRGRRDAVRELRQHGAVVRTDYPDVLVMRVDDPGGFAEVLAGRFVDAPGLADCISRVIPAETVFDFLDADELEARVLAHTPEIVPRLAGGSFHIRIHRRGLKGKLPSRVEEQRIGQALIEAVSAAGRPARAEFDDPDVIVAIVTVDTRASLSLWTRDQRRRMPFLKLD
jgi:tRNA(Ser,Leu) C12 N-acetylase TAN1